MKTGTLDEEGARKRKLEGNGILARAKHLQDLNSFPKRLSSKHHLCISKLSFYDQLSIIYLIYSGEMTLSDVDNLDLT